MPQLDKLTFTSQIFWFFLFFIVLYYFFVQIVVLRIKFALGLKRFFLQSDKNLNFYQLVKNFHLESRNGLIFFFSNDSLDSSSSKNILSHYISSVSNFFSTKESGASSDYIFVLNFDKNYYSSIYNLSQTEKQIELRKLGLWTKNIVFFYEKFNSLLGSFFKSVQFYIYEVNFTLFYYFFNVFFKFKNILYYIKLVNRL